MISFIISFFVFLINSAQFETGCRSERSFLYDVLKANVGHSAFSASCGDQRYFSCRLMSSNMDPAAVPELQAELCQSGFTVWKRLADSAGVVAQNRSGQIEPLRILNILEVKGENDLSGKRDAIN